MNPHRIHSELAVRRLHNQRLAGGGCASPEDVVHWLGAVQAQEYPKCKWALGQRADGATDAEVGRAFDEGRILRLHVMRPTWHFVTPADARWLLELTAPRVHAANASAYRKQELDEETFRRSEAALVHALQGGATLTRAEIKESLQHAGVEPGGPVRFGHLLMHAELERVICSGPLRGKQHTYTLLEERAPQGRRLEREEALAELARRYFTSHGPATVDDCSWWSGLTKSEVRQGIDLAGGSLVEESFAGKSYWSGEPAVQTESGSPIVRLLPDFDEYFIAYKDRSALFERLVAEKVRYTSDDFFYPPFLVDDQIAGAWKRTIKKDGAVIETKIMARLNDEETRAFQEAVRRYESYLGMPVSVL